MLEATGRDGKVRDPAFFLEATALYEVVGDGVVVTKWYIDSTYIFGGGAGVGGWHGDVCCRPVVRVLMGSSSCSRVPVLFCSPAPRIQMSIPHPGCIYAECTQALMTACPSPLG
ncbi:hypothetical protein VOLCADRAFT_87687 [Volvox carteri f. nagariensis]|nr:uncharacterized protein VOLCADRAFT_87687 [Volvox carteri f. nagariensis]EFJ51551.1 hypothetical protein VOLCADRAFT_87687 [Volvox carteri f. nagariensis]|eukprot:XP_002947503.1 hypothetical protein VOLCADRAFT_87687 [Volvox carteri f. nagariensis]